MDEPERIGFKVEGAKPGKHNINSAEVAGQPMAARLCSRGEKTTKSLRHCSELDELFRAPHIS